MESVSLVQPVHFMEFKTVIAIALARSKRGPSSGISAAFLTSLRIRGDIGSLCGAAALESGRYTLLWLN